MITLRLGQHHLETHEAAALIEAIGRQEKSCDTVWFSTLYGYPPLLVQQEAADKMAAAAALFRQAGIGVSMQVSNTLGHGEYMKSKDCSGLVYDGSPAEHMVGANGEAAGYCFCWRGEHFRRYLEDSLALYAQVKPDVVWFDDDLRADNHYPVEYGCYCDHCISGFNAIYGTSFSRASLVREINYGNPIWRQRFIDYCRQGMAELVESLVKAIMRVSPESRFGMQYSHWCNYMGSNDNHILNAIKKASGHVAQVRPGGGYYHDKNPLEQFAKTMRLACTSSLLPDEIVDRKAEIENLPDVAFGKSIGGTLIESTLHLACGCTGLTYATLMNPNEPLAWHEKMLAGFSQIRPYWEKLADVSRHAYRSGLTIFHGEAPHRKKLSAEEAPFSWINFPYENNTKLMIVGIPVTHDQHKPAAYLLHHEMIDHLTDRDIAYLLTQPVLADAASVQKLYDRGYRDCFRLTLKPQPAGPAFERFMDHHVNGTAGMRFAESPFFTVPMPKYVLEAKDDTTDILGETCYGITEETLGGSAALTQVYQADGTPAARWAVFGYCLWNDIISTAKRNQILNALDTLCPLPAKLISAEQAAVIPSVDSCGRTVSVTVASASPGGTEELELLIRSPRSTVPVLMSTRYQPIEPLKTEQSEGSLLLTLPPLQPYEIATVFL